VTDPGLRVWIAIPRYRTSCAPFSGFRHTHLVALWLASRPSAIPLVDFFLYCFSVNLPVSEVVYHLHHERLRRLPHPIVLSNGDTCPSSNHPSAILWSFGRARIRELFWDCFEAATSGLGR